MGLEKLHETAVQIEQLNVKLAVQKVVLEEKTTSCEVLMDEINDSTKTATVKKTQAQDKSTELAKQSKVIVAEKVSRHLCVCLYVCVDDIQNAKPKA